MAPPTATELQLVRTRPAFEKLAVGPIMIFGEMVTGGHYLEILRLGKQMHVGRTRSPSYFRLHQNFMNESGGKFVGAFYRGFFPWSLFQCAKGIPVLFVQHESMYQLQARGGWSNRNAERVSGFLGGTAQALFVCPFQKIKVTVVADHRLNNMGPLEAIKAVIRKNGFSSLMDGIVPMAIRRSLDWGIRFAVSGEVKNWIQNYKRRNGHQSEQLEFYELLFCGLVGGACSASTHPIDNMITNSQKPLAKHGAKRDLLSVVVRMYKESGTKAFTRGWGIKIVDNAYHMMWMYGVGTVAYDYLAKAVRNF